MLTHGHRYTVYQNDRVPRCDPKATSTHHTGCNQSPMFQRYDSTRIGRDIGKQIALAIFAPSSVASAATPHAS